MDIWVFTEKSEDGFYSSTHLTEKGCLLTAVDVLIDVLGVDTDTEEMWEQWKRTEQSWEDDTQWDALPCPVGWREMTLKELWNIYEHYEPLTWERVEFFDCGVNKTQVAP